MTIDKFIIFIEKLGFGHYHGSYYCENVKGFTIRIDSELYLFNDRIEWYKYKYSDLEPINKNYKKELRSIKLKQLLR